MQKNNKFKLGLFVVCAIAGCVILLSLMGLFEQFKPKAHLATFVKESTQGLSNDSPVKYKGVVIGSVSNVTIILESDLIRIDMEIDLTRLTKRTRSDAGEAEEIGEWDFYRYLDSEAMGGLCCRIEPDGITGAKYVEVDFDQKSAKLQPTMAGMKKAGLYKGVYYLPSTQSILANLRVNVTQILASIAAIDFEGLSKDAKNMVAKMDHAVSQLSALFDKSITPQKTEKMLNEIQGVLESIHLFSDNMNKSLTQADIPGTMEVIRELSEQMKVSNTNARRTLLKLDDAIDSVTELVQYLNENPSAILHGRITKEEK